MVTDSQRKSLWIEPPLGVAARQGIVTRLMREPGIVSATFDHHEPQRLHVAYDAAHFSPLTLADFIARQGVTARIERD